VSESAVPPANDRAPEAREEALELAHHHPGRLRVRADALRDDAARIESVTRLLDGAPGVTRVVHNARTGSFLVEYEPGHTEPEELVARIASAAGLLSPFDPRARKMPVQPAMTLIDGVRGLNAITSELTGGRADLRAVVPAALAGLAAYSFSREKVRLPRWDNLLWWSYSIVTALHENEVLHRTPPDDGGSPSP
jgi:hypothetical protein